MKIGKVKMTTRNYTVTFKKTVLASFVGLCFNQACFALEALSDNSLSDMTGEGIAILPQDTFMVFRGAGANESVDTILADRTKDSGYIHAIPVGPLSSLVQDTNKDGKVNNLDHSVGKADLYIYGLAVSKNSNNDTNSRLDSGKNAQGLANAAIKSWGTAANPWVFKVDTDLKVPNFLTGPDCLGSVSTGCSAEKYNNSVTYLNLEAPLYDLVRPTTPETGADAYKLKLALWADTFVRDQSKVDGDPNQFRLGELFSTTGPNAVTDPAMLERANRIRLQMIWNNFSINGSRLQMFQTLGGATNTAGMSSFYNNTLGIASAVRLNSGDASALKATVINGGVSTATLQTFTTNRFTTAYPGAPWNNGQGDPHQFYRMRTVGTIEDVQAGAWIAPNGLNDNVLRLSTRESAETPLLATPALASGTVPIFDPNEGLFIYNLNANLILGSLYQPLTFGSDGNNFSMEIARIPNKETIYKKIYTDYTGADKTYLGSTCNVYQCGSNGLAGYQGNNATHSSISIGTAYSQDGGKTLLADSTAGAVGVSFGKLGGGGSRVASQNVGYQVQVQYRQPVPGVNTGANSWQYLTAVNNGTITGIDPLTGRIVLSAGATANYTAAGACNENASGSNCYNFKAYPDAWFNIDSFSLKDQNTNGGDGVKGTDGPAGNVSTGKYVIQFGGNGAARCQISTSGGCTVEGYRPDVIHSQYTMLSNMPCKTGAAVNAANCYLSTADYQWTVDGWGGMQKGSDAATSNKNAYGADWNSATNTWKSNPITIATPAATVNYNPQNNLGSAVIDGLLIQHMKIKTTGL